MKKLWGVTFSIIILAGLLIVSSGLFMGAGRVLANGGEPPGCYQNNFFVNVGKSPAGYVHQGETIQYTVLVGNNGSPNACNVTSTDVSFTQPAANGTARRM